jgi:hypothetical protein
MPRSLTHLKIQTQRRIAPGSIYEQGSHMFPTCQDRQITGTTQRKTCGNSSSNFAHPAFWRSPRGLCGLGAIASDIPTYHSPCGARRSAPGVAVRLFDRIRSAKGSLILPTLVTQGHMSNCSTSVRSLPIPRRPTNPCFRKRRI